MSQKYLVDVTCPNWFSWDFPHVWLKYVISGNWIRGNVHVSVKPKMVTPFCRYIFARFGLICGRGRGAHRRSTIELYAVSIIAGMQPCLVLSAHHIAPPPSVSFETSITPLLPYTHRMSFHISSVLPVPLT